jgi:hypothetical protein
VAAVKRTIRALLSSLSKPFFRPISRRIEDVDRRTGEVEDLAVRLDRQLPAVESAIESQNTELRSRARGAVEFRAEVERMKSELARTRLQLESLRQEVMLAKGAELANGAAPELDA